MEEVLGIGVTCCDATKRSPGSECRCGVGKVGLDEAPTERMAASGAERGGATEI